MVPISLYNFKGEEIKFIKENIYMVGILGQGDYKNKKYKKIGVEGLQ